MIREFKTINEAKAVIKEVVDNYLKDVSIMTKGVSLGNALQKQISFIILAQPNDKLDEMKDELILLRAKGYPIEKVEWNIKWADQMDMVEEIISITTTVKVFKR